MQETDDNGGGAGMTRRRLLLAGGAAVAAAGAARGQTPAPAQPQPGTAPETKGQGPLPPGERVGFAIVGIGDFATNQIIPSFAETRRCRLTGFVTGDPVKGRAFAERFGVDPKNVFTYDQMDRLARVPEVEVAYVITPNGLHRQHAEKAAAAGKHVLCEKPLATSSKDCEAMIAACRKAGKKLMTAYRARYEPYNEAAIKLCREGKLGRIVSVTSDHGRILNPAEPRDHWRAEKALSGGGSLPDIGIYSLQAARYLTGEEPVEVTAWLEKPENDPRFREVEATVHWTLRFPSGALANCSSSYDWSDVKRAQVFGSEANLTLDPATDYYRHELIVSRKDKATGAPVQENHKIEEKNQFARMMDHFAECVRENKEPRTPGEEGLRDVRIIEAIYESARTGRPVKLRNAA